MRIFFFKVRCYNPPFYLEATGQLHYEMEYKRSGILTVNGFISATQRF